MTKYNTIIVLLLLKFVINKNLTKGIYKIRYKNLYLNFHHKRNKFYFSRKSTLSKTSFFRIYNDLDNSFYLIESVKSNKLLFYDKNRISSITKVNKSEDKYFWSFINNKSSVIIKNKKGCYIKIASKYKLTCVVSFEEASKFNLIKIYEEASHTKEDMKLIEKEPIDILIKYIDLKDPNLKRNGIHQIDKDIDNEELRYSIRSILQNIPWIRKIFILMPNEKVRYFKEPDEIKEKIVYVKDKDLIGFDSSSSLVFQFRYWKMKEFNISDNFLALDDDCFIGKPLNKSDFFYVQNNTVLPLIINSHLDVYKKSIVQRNKYYCKRIIKRSHLEQTNNDFKYSKYLTYLFIMNIFKKKRIVVPKFTHNAIPINVNEMREIYNLIEKSEYNKTTLYSKYRHIKSLQFQTLYISFTFIKYQKKVHNIPYKYIKFKNSFYSRFNYPLFCINTNAYQNSEISKKLFIVTMEKLFPMKSPYELIDSSKSEMQINVIKQLKYEKNKLENKLNKLKKEMIKYKNLKNNVQNIKNESNLNKVQLIFDNSDKKKIFIYSLALALISLVKLLILI